jgi:hypothetical protein
MYVPRLMSENQDYTPEKNRGTETSNNLISPKKINGNDNYIP